MKQLGIIGCGALGRQILGLLFTSGSPDRLALFDDVLHKQNAENGFPFDAFLDSSFADYDFYIGLGYHHLPRKVKILRQLLFAGRRVPSFIHPSCHRHSTARIGEGCVVYPLCNLDQGVELGHGVLLNNSVVVSHDSRLGDGVYCSPGVVLSGHVAIGEAAFLGTGALVSNNRKLGARARVGIGSVVTIDVPDDGCAIGNPVRLLNSPLELE